MAAATDILFGDDDDLSIANGDLVTGFSDEQHLALITIMDLGHLKENPFLGIGIRSDLGGAKSANEIKANAQQMYEADNYNVNSIIVKGSLIVNVDCSRL